MKKVDPYRDGGLVTETLDDHELRLDLVEKVVWGDEKDELSLRYKIEDAQSTIKSLRWAVAGLAIVMIAVVVGFIIVLDQVYSDFNKQLENIHMINIHTDTVISLERP